MKIVIIDTGCANLSSVKFAVERLGYAVTVSKDALILEQADKLFLPGVGTAKEAMANLIERDLVPLIKALTQPVLGICLGMQILAEASEEGFGDHPIINTLAIIDGHIKKMDVAPLRSPHMGWNQITPTLDHPLFKQAVTSTLCTAMLCRLTIILSPVVNMARHSRQLLIKIIFTGCSFTLNVLVKLARN